MLMLFPTKFNWLRLTEIVWKIEEGKKKIFFLYTFLLLFE